MSISSPRACTHHDVRLGELAHGQASVTTGVTSSICLNKGAWMFTSTRRAIAAAAVLVLGLSACGGGGVEGEGEGGGGGGDDNKIVVWTGDTLPDRVAATKEIIAKFTEASGVQVELVGVDEDLFEKAGVQPPQTYDDIMAAAKALDSSKVAGFVGATAAGDAFTQQTFEHLALGNGCQMVDDAGEVTMDSPQCVAAFEFYGDLIKSYSVSGTQDVDTVRASYFAGQSAMAIWSTFLLDELAGLRN